MAFFGRKSPLEMLVMPAVCKYNQFRQRRREAQSKKVTERELTALHHKIEKLLSKLEESELEPSSTQEDECVICITSRATMKTLPCGHQVVCRRCFVKTIQSAVAQRLLPLRCVICRARINRLTSSSGTTWRLQESASSYSVGSKSWSVPGSASSFSVGAHSYTMGEKVTQSASLYSMSSGSSSCASGYSSGSGSATSRGSNVSSSSSNGHLHNGGSCSTNGCSGAIPRTPSMHFRGHKSHSFRSRIPDLPNRLPPIKEYTVRSPSRHRTPSPVNSGVRFKNYTSSSKNLNTSEIIPLLDEPSTSTAPPSATKKLNNSKVAPIISKATLISKSNTQPASVKPSSSSLGFKPYTVSSTPSTSKSSNATSKPTNSAASKDDKKNDTKKNEEKLKQKAEKEAKKEEKRLAKEEEKIAKLRAKEEKKRGKIESKALLVT